MLKDNILYELENNHDYLSGQELADRYGVSRNAVWKAINSLKKQGYRIDSTTNRGYILHDDGEVLSDAGIAVRLDKLGSSNIIDNIYVHDELDSTNNEAKRILASSCDAGHFLIVCDEQKKGRGRNGGAFDSPAGVGVYMSLVYKLDTPIKKQEIIYSRSIKAVVDAVYKGCNISLDVKSDSGLYCNDVKIGGVLIEAVTGIDSGYMGHIIIGVGVNIDAIKANNSNNSQNDNLLNSMNNNNMVNNISRNDLIAVVTDELISVYSSGEFF